MAPKKVPTEVFVNLEKKKTTKKKTASEELAECGITLGRVLGQGAYAKVRAAMFHGKEIAVKVINKEKLTPDLRSKFLPREIELLSKLKHENIVKVLKIYNFPKKVYICMELIEADLLGYVLSRGRLTEEESRFFFKQMISALKYLHGLNIAHRDLKCENIMLNEKRQVKLIDFGFCRSTVDSNGRRKLSETYCGSAAYAAPEVLQGEPYNPMLNDVWSLGCVLYIMTTGLMPFDDSHLRKLVRTQLKRQFKFYAKHGLSRSLKDLIRHMLEPDITKRYSIERASHSEWMKEENNDDSIEHTASKTQVSTKRNGQLVSKANISGKSP